MSPLLSLHDWSDKKQPPSGFLRSQTHCILQIVVSETDDTMFNPQISEAVDKLHDSLCNVVLPFSESLEDAHRALIFLGKTMQADNNAE